MRVSRRGVWWAGTVAAVAAVSGCGVTSGPDPAPSPATSDATGPAFISERDLGSLMNPEDMLEGFEMHEYFSIVGIPGMVDYILGVENLGVIEPVGCSDLVSSSSLVTQADIGSFSSDTVTYLFDVGAVGEAETDPSIMVLARLFATPEDATAYLDRIAELAIECQDGITETYADGTFWSTIHVSSSVDSNGYPEGIAATTLAYFYDSSSNPTTQVYFQYQNAVVAAADIQSATSIVVAPSDLHRIMRTMAERILALG